MKAVLVQTNTPTEKGSYSFQGAGIVVCSPCCGNTFHAEHVPQECNPLTAGPLTCPACRKQFAVTHGDFVLIGLTENSKVEVTPSDARIVKPKKADPIDSA